MSADLSLILSTLKLTKTGSALIGNIRLDARVTSVLANRFFQLIQNEGVASIRNENLEIAGNGRLKLAIKALLLGADIQNISNFLGWKEFEEICASALTNNGYEVKNNVRFKQRRRNWEIDVVGIKKPLVLCIDCKHWNKTIGTSTLSKIVDSQVNRTSAFADSLPNIKLKIKCVEWEQTKFIPVVLSLVPCAYKYLHDVPIVPVLKLQDFIMQLPAYTKELRFFSKTFPC